MLSQRSFGFVEVLHQRIRSGALSGLFAGEIRFPGLKPRVETP
jgi:hypothetical protein